jgi:hypothetical protein
MSKAAAPAPVVAVDPEVSRVERAFAAGNFALVRSFAATSSSPGAKEAAERLVPKMSVQREQALVGVAGLLVISVAAALTLVSG